MSVNPHLIIFGALELSLTLVLGIFTLWIVHHRLQKLLGISVEQAVAAKNIAVPLFGGVYAFCMISLTTESVVPSVNALRTMEQVRDVLELRMFAISMGYGVLLFVVAAIVGHLLLALTLKVITTQTRKLDEFAEIRAGSIPTAMFLGLTILAMTSIARPAVRTLLEGLISYDYLNAVGRESTPRAIGTPKFEESVQ